MDVIRFCQYQDYTLFYQGKLKKSGAIDVDSSSPKNSWSGPVLADIFKNARIRPEAKIAIFHTADDSKGFTSLSLTYILERNIIIALKDNDITLTLDRGFPFQVVAESKYGYKWAKRVTRIELSSDTTFRGYTESYGYNNGADIGGPIFGQSTTPCKFGEIFYESREMVYF